jgi:hypothetical protein
LAHSSFQFFRSTAHDGEKKGGKPVKAPTAGADPKGTNYRTLKSGASRKWATRIAALETETQRRHAAGMDWPNRSLLERWLILLAIIAAVWPGLFFFIELFGDNRLMYADALVLVAIDAGVQLLMRRRLA